MEPTRWLPPRTPWDIIDPFQKRTKLAITITVKAIQIGCWYLWNRFGI
jgi:hypothetical protein